MTVVTEPEFSARLGTTLSRADLSGVAADPADPVPGTGCWSCLLSLSKKRG